MFLSSIFFPLDKWLCICNFSSVVVSYVMFDILYIIGEYAGLRKDSSVYYGHGIFICD